MNTTTTIPKLSTTNVTNISTPSTSIPNLNKTTTKIPKLSTTNITKIYIPSTTIPKFNNITNTITRLPTTTKINSILTTTIPILNKTTISNFNKTSTNIPNSITPTSIKNNHFDEYNNTIITDITIIFSTDDVASSTYTESSTNISLESTYDISSNTDVGISTESFTDEETMTDVSTMPSSYTSPLTGDYISETKDIVSTIVENTDLSSITEQSISTFSSNSINTENSYDVSTNDVTTIIDLNDTISFGSTFSNIQATVTDSFNVTIKEISDVGISDSNKETSDVTNTIQIIYNTDITETTNEPAYTYSSSYLPNSSSINTTVDLTKSYLLENSTLTNQYINSSDSVTLANNVSVFSDIVSNTFSNSIGESTKNDFIATTNDIEASNGLSPETSFTLESSPIVDTEMNTGSETLAHNFTSSDISQETMNFDLTSTFSSKSNDEKRSSITEGESSTVADITSQENLDNTSTSSVNIYDTSQNIDVTNNIVFDTTIDVSTYETSEVNTIEGLTEDFTSMTFSDKKYQSKITDATNMDNEYSASMEDLMNTSEGTSVNYYETVSYDSARNENITYDISTSLSTEEDIISTNTQNTIYKSLDRFTNTATPITDTTDNYTK